MTSSGVAVGMSAPDFRLPAGRGGEIALSDYRGRAHVIVWFTKGMACAFCRQHMGQLTRLYPRIRALGAEVLEIAPTPLARARFYAERFGIPFPYLSDVDFAARRAWGLGVRGQSLLGYGRALAMYVRSAKPVTTEYESPPSATVREMPGLLTDDDMGFFVVDREGVVRYALAGSAALLDASRRQFQGMRGIPGNDEILRALDACAAPA